MKSFFEKDDYTLGDVLSLIENEVEESVYLDFKASGSLDKTDEKKKEISKDISAFANSDGGIIIYGINEINHKASSISYINGKTFTKEWLEQVINSNIQRHIDGIRIFPLRNEGRIEESVYIVKIPQSVNAPHICKDKRFYKRNNFESVMMEEYEVRQLYNQKLKTQLSICNFLMKTPETVYHSGETFYSYKIIVIVENIGNTVEEHFKLQLRTVNFPKGVRYSWEKDNSTQTFFESTPDKIYQLAISSANKTVIFPAEKIHILDFDLLVPISARDIIMKEGFIRLKLYYTGGTDELEIDLSKSK